MSLDNENSYMSSINYPFQKVEFIKSKVVKRLNSHVDLLISDIKTCNINASNDGVERIKLAVQDLQRNYKALVQQQLRLRIQRQQSGYYTTPLQKVKSRIFNMKSRVRARKSIEIRKRRMLFKLPPVVCDFQFRLYGVMLTSRVWSSKQPLLLRGFVHEVADEEELKGG